MEMELAKACGWVGKCEGCLYCNYINLSGSADCQKKGKIRKRENCEDWVLDHR